MDLNAAAAATCRTLSARLNYPQTFNSMLFCPSAAQSAPKQSVQIKKRQHRQSESTPALCNQASIIRHMLCTCLDKHAIFLHLRHGRAGWQVHLLHVEDVRLRLAESAPSGDRYMDGCRMANVEIHMDTKMQSGVQQHRGVMEPRHRMKHTTLMSARHRRCSTASREQRK